jgi:VWFA-related protein
MKSVLAVFASLAVLQASAPPSSPAPQEQSFRSGATGVILDVVVRDRRGRPVRDIQQSEITVLEDGVSRDVKTFRLVERAETRSTVEPPPAAAGQPDALRLPTLITMVFDHLTQNSRSLARKAALQFVSRGIPEDQWVAVFSLEQRLRLEQAFTRDADAIRRAIERATLGASETRDRAAATHSDRDAAERAADAALGTLNAERPPGDTGAIGAAISDARVREVLARMARMVETADLQQRGQSTLFPLMALLKAQGSLTGRKALLFFSEGLAIPSNLEEAYRSAISEANRANVSIYAVDARGLDTGRSLDQSRQMLERSARNSQSQVTAGASQRPVTMDDVMNSETAESALRTDTQNALRALAEETSGALIANTNDLGSGLVHVATDLDSYYEIGYAPAAVPPDGRFRSVQVKIARRGVIVQSRSGYFALPETDTAPLMPYELPMLSAAAADTPPRAFEYAARVFRFHPTPKGVQHTLLVEIPLEQLTFQENRRARTYALRFTAMALIKDSGGQVVQRFSESYPLEGPIDRLPALKRGRLRFKRQFSVAPGRYTLVTIARDQAAERSSVRSLPLAVPDPSQGIRISDLSIIRSVEPAGDAADSIEDPFRTGAIRVAPNLDLAISKAANPQMSAYVTIYPGASGTPALTFEFIRDGALVGRSAAELPTPDESGRIKYVATFPTQTFGPGQYELRAVATQGGTNVIAQTAFVLVE